MAFYQSPPELGNQYDDDRVLRSYIARRIPADARARIEGELREVGALAGGELHRSVMEGRLTEPTLTQWDAWGHRIDKIEINEHWKRARVIAAEKGVVATGYENKTGEHSRVHQFALVYLFEPSSGVYSCPLAMTDGAAKTLSVAGNKALADRALPRLLSRNIDTQWTSGQWMTERTGGSDVAISETIAKKDGDNYRLYGTKWFTSATTSEMALTLGRPEGNPPGGSGLALFYLETRDAQGRLNGIQINRLKDKLGTRMVPTAELTLDGALAIPVTGSKDGIRNITPMLSITRTWNAICAAAGMRRAVTLARDYAKRRVAFGAKLSEKPLHVDTLAGAEAETQGAFMLAFRASELLGREEAKTLTDAEAALMRMLVPLAKLTTGKQAVAVISEMLEAFGGAGYVEDTGLPRMLRDAQVLPIWEGTTNVLSLDVLRALGRSGGADPLVPLVAEVHDKTSRASDVDCKEPAEAARTAVSHAQKWLGETFAMGPQELERGARRFALTLGRALEVAYLVDEAAWQKSANMPVVAGAAARRLAKNGISIMGQYGDPKDSDLLAG
jgi:alkylation response protein AidB-like acyl-CoA dehydrogenase